MLLPSADALAARIPDGALVAIPPDNSLPSVAIAKALIRRGARGLRLLGVPVSGFATDILIGAGCVAEVETSAVSLGEAGGAPRFNQAIAQGRVVVRDATCPAIHAALMAAQKGNPFQPLRGIIGSDILRFRPDWRVIDNPFAEDGDPIVLIPAARPDIAIFHAPMADRHGNVWIGRRRELAAMAYAADQTLVTVERIVEENLLGNEMSAAGTLPALYVTEIAVAPRGAWPYGLWGEYATDTAEILRYAKAARTPEGFAEYMAAAPAGQMQDAAR
jgi:glutaconate CoA-transferase subunit A